MSDAYAPPRAELREDLPPKRRLRNAFVGVGFGLGAALLMVFLLESSAGQKPHPWYWGRLAVVLLLPALAAGALGAALPRARASWIALAAPPVAMVTFFVTMVIVVRVLYPNLRF